MKEALVKNKRVMYDVYSSEKNFLKARLSYKLKVFKYIGKTTKIFVNGFEQSEGKLYLFVYRKKYLHLRKIYKWEFMERLFKSMYTHKVV